MLWGNPPKWSESHEQIRKIGGERNIITRLWACTLINDSKLPLNNLKLQIERGLARRLLVWVLNSPLGCLEYKELVRKSKDFSFYARDLPCIFLAFENRNFFWLLLIIKSSSNIIKTHFNFSSWSITGQREIDPLGMWVRVSISWQALRGAEWPCVWLRVT